MAESNRGTDGSKRSGREREHAEEYGEKRGQARNTAAAPPPPRDRRPKPPRAGKQD